MLRRVGAYGVSHHLCVSSRAWIGEGRLTEEDIQGATSIGTTGGIS